MLVLEWQTSSVSLLTMLVKHNRQQRLGFQHSTDRALSFAQSLRTMQAVVIFLAFPSQSKMEDIHSQASSLAGVDLSGKVGWWRR